MKVGRKTKGIGAALLLLGVFSQVAYAAPPYRNMMPTPTISSCQEGSQPCRSDGGHLAVYRGYLGPIMKASTGYTLFGSYGTTDVGPVYEHSYPVESGVGETDIIYKYYQTTPSTYGTTICDDNSIGSNRCDQFYIYFNSTVLNSHTSQHYFNDFATTLACHETGHAVGLTHGNNAYTSNGDVISQTLPALHCMRTELLPHMFVDWKVGSNNTYWINDTY